jgi:hypothetical protein
MDICEQSATCMLLLLGMIHIEVFGAHYEALLKSLVLVAGMLKRSLKTSTFLYIVHNVQLLPIHQIPICNRNCVNCSPWLCLLV